MWLKTIIDYDIQALDHTKGDLFLFDTSVALKCILRDSKDQSEFWPEETNNSHTSGKQLWFTFDAPTLISTGF